MISQENFSSPDIIEQNNKNDLPPQEPFNPIEQKLE
jgi:hypothetical protein